MNEKYMAPAKKKFPPRAPKQSPGKERASCFFSCLWLGVMALWDGSVKPGEFGWKIAPRFGPMIDLLTGYTMPCLCAGILSTIGSILGIISCVGCVGEALLQLFIHQPYKVPVSRMLVDWVPEI